MNDIGKISVQMLQLNNSYGNNVFIPYSAGILRAYCEKDKILKDAYEFRPFIYMRDSVNALVDKIGQVDILCLSSYIWNWRLSMAVASEIRKSNLGCLIIAGGPQVPNDIEDFFIKYPYIDITVHGEGEETFYEILKTHMNAGSFKSISGMSYFDRSSGKLFNNGMRSKMTAIDDIPSPYLNDIFKELVENKTYDWIAMWETNRGCPFTCAYCDWGTGSKKVRKFAIDRLYKEMEWFGKNKIQLVFGCDANFGMFKRDMDLVEQLIKMKKIYGFPFTFRVCNTKNSNETVFNIESALYQSGLSKGASLSMQSLSNEVLKNIKRSNIKLDTFHKLQNKYAEKGMSTYTELILPLPGETYDSFINGINTLLVNGQHSQLNIYNCSIMVNAEMGQKSYQERHGIKTVEIPIFQAHSTPNKSANSVTEYEEIIIETNTMPVNDWRKSFCFAWGVQCFHYLGILQAVAILFANAFKIKYNFFYESLIQYGRENPDTTIGRELNFLDDLLDNVLRGIGFDQYLPEFGEVTWPAEEASFLRLSENIDTLYLDSSTFLKKLLFGNKIGFEDRLIEDILKYQRSRLVNYNDDNNAGEEIALHLKYNIPEYVDSIVRGSMDMLTQSNDNYYIVIRNRNFAGDKKRFAQEAVWYGRKGGKFLYGIKKAT